MRRMLECNPVINLFSTYYSPSLKDFLTFYPKSRPDAWLSFQADFLSKNLLFQQTKKICQDSRLSTSQNTEKTVVHWAKNTLNIQNHALLASKMGKIQTERKTSKVTRTSDVFLGFHLCLTNFLGSHLACRMLCNNFIVSRFTRIHYLHYRVKSLTQRVLSFFVFFFLTKPWN